MNEGKKLTAPVIDISEFRSKNFGYRKSEIMGIVLHQTFCRFENAIDWYSEKKSRVSTHLIIARDGRVAQILPFDKLAFHSGRALIDHATIGIELECDIKTVGLAPIQEAKLVAWLKFLFVAYNMSKENVSLHRNHKVTLCPQNLWASDLEFVKWLENSF